MPKIDPLNSVPFTKEIISFVVSAVNRLRAERKAGENPFDFDANEMDRIISESLSRLQTGNISTSWWQDLTSLVGRKFVMPEYLEKSAVQKWLSDEFVAENLKKIAIARIMGNDDEISKITSVLAEKYSEETGEHKSLATVPIEGAVAILIAGFLASIPREIKPVIAAIQQVGKSLQSDSERQEQTLEFQPHLLASKQALNKEVRVRLSRILSVSNFGESSSVDELRELLDETESGSLALIDSALKAEILYWTARLCATNAETLEFAKHLQRKLRISDCEFNLFVIDALIKSTEGFHDEAIRILRDKTDSDSHSVCFSFIVKYKSEQEGLAWYTENNKNDDIGFFTPFGWCYWGAIKASSGGWDEVLMVLPEMESQWEHTPMLAVIEGSSNAAKLVPEQIQSSVLNGPPLYQGITQKEESTAFACHRRATKCFDFAASRLESNLARPWLNLLKDWQVWLSLMNPDSIELESSRRVISERMKNGEHAVRLIPFAYAFEIEFDDGPLTNLLKYRKKFGGLNDEDLKADFFLNIKNLDSADLLNYLNQNKSRLQRIIPEGFLVSLHVNSMISMNKDPKVVKNFIQNSAIGDDQKNRMMIAFDASQGKDVGEQLKSHFEQTNSFFDLRNCVHYFRETGNYENFVSISPTRDIHHG